jgi:integrase
VLLEQTTRRRGSIARLHWDDFDFRTQRIMWRAAHDKKRRSWLIRYGPALFDEPAAFKECLGRAGGCVFPTVDDTSTPIRPELISQWLAKAQRSAGVPKLAGGLCHPYRRKWKSEKANHPVKAVANAGGWIDIPTMLRSYDIPDDAAILAVTSDPTRRWEAPPTTAASTS